MKECDYGRISSCYGSLVRAIYEEAKKANDEWEKSRARHGKIIDKMRNKLMEGGFLDDTHDKVYGLNRQMCDLGKTINNPMKPLSEEVAQEIAKALETTRNPIKSVKPLSDGNFDKDFEELRKILDMEKKTKKMTKAEAFEWLKCKKIDCRYASSSQVQAKLFEIDMCWVTGDKNICVAHLLFIDADGCISHCGYDDEYFDKHHYTQVSADDILSIEIVEEDGPLDKWEEFASKVAKIQETLEDDEVCIITKTNFLTMTK